MENNVPKKNIKKNFAYNLAYQILLIVIPFITTPYISRVLNPEGVGIYSFSMSLITYFTIFASLGFANYAQREIAKEKDKVKQSISFWEIIICRLASVSIAIGVNLILYFTGVYGKYSQIMLILTINIASVAFDIAFLYQGNEEFGKIVLPSALSRIVGVILIFLFVKNKDDILPYTLISSASGVIAFVLMWLQTPKMLTKVNIKELSPMRHLKGTLLLFIPTIAVSIYTVLDKTLIGVLVDPQFANVENGYYEQAEKISKMALTIITCIGSVMIPRNTKEFAEGNIDKVKRNIYYSSRLIWFIGLPMCLGLFCVAPNFVPWFFGQGYDKCGILIGLLSFLIIIIGFSNVFGLQYLIPAKKDKTFTIALVLGAFINFCLNIVFIKLWMSIGAAIATLIAESCVTLFMAYKVRKEIDLKEIVICSWKYIISAGLMFGIVFFIRRFFASSILNTILLALIGASIYFICLIVLKDSFFINESKIIISKVKHTINRKKQ